MGDGPRVGLFIAAAFAAAAISSAYLPLWFADRGLTASEIGIVLGLGSGLRVLIVPGWGWVADAVGRRRLVLFVAAASAAGAALLLPAVHGFLPILLLSAVQGVSASALTPLSDSLTIALAAARRLDYGQTRAYGSVSYMLATAGAGLVLNEVGSGAVPFVLAAGFGLAAGWAILLPEVPVPPRSFSAPEGLFRSRAFRLTLIATALIQGAHAAYYSFAPLHWRAAGLDDGTIGLLIAEGIVAEVALFVWGRSLVERLGPARLTALAAGASVVRWTALAFVTDVPGLILLQPLHSITFACQHLSAMLVLRRMAPARAGVAQATLSALGYSAPTGLLAWVSGQVFAGWGGFTFLLMTGVAACALPVAWRMRDGRV